MAKIDSPEIRYILIAKYFGQFQYDIVLVHFYPIIGRKEKKSVTKTLKLKFLAKVLKNEK